MKPRTRVRRIGITGSAHAGKTVFLLSLIDHLKYGDLKLGTDGTTRFKHLPYSDEEHEFKYDLLRKHLAASKWPPKTKDYSLYRCRFERPVSALKLKEFWKPNRWSPVKRISDDEIEFFDFPGERVADVTMFDQSFGEWSDTVIRGLDNDPNKATAAEPFVRLINTDAPSVDALVAAWKLTLGRLILDCHALITPSTFLIDAEKGQTALERVREVRKANQLDLDSKPDAKELATVCCAGLPGKEFAPLPASVRKNAPELARLFGEHYENYQQRVVRPFAKHLLSCHALIFLVDIAHVLGSGVQKLNDTGEIIEKLMACIERGRGVIGSTLRGTANFVGAIVGRKWRFIDRIAFVASKADKIHDRDRDNLKLLLDDLSDRAAGGFGPREVGCFTCTAVNSTVSRDDHILQGRPIRIFKDGKFLGLPTDADEIDVPVPELPSHWPDRWRVEDFRFPEFHPKIPPIHRQPPEQAGLDAVLRFALGV